jgi:hypothetical protein
VAPSDRLGRAPSCRLSLIDRDISITKSTQTVKSNASRITPASRKVITRPAQNCQEGNLIPPPNAAAQQAHREAHRESPMSAGTMARMSPSDSGSWLA